MIAACFAWIVRWAVIFCLMKEWDFSVMMDYHMENTKVLVPSSSLYLPISPLPQNTATAFISHPSVNLSGVLYEPTA